MAAPELALHSLTGATLAELRDQGLFTEAEFTEAKAALLRKLHASAPPAPVVEKLVGHDWPLEEVTRRLTDFKAKVAKVRAAHGDEKLVSFVEEAQDVLVLVRGRDFYYDLLSAAETIHEQGVEIRAMPRTERTRSEREERQRLNRTIINAVAAFQSRVAGITYNA